MPVAAWGLPSGCGISGEVAPDQGMRDNATVDDQADQQVVIPVAEGTPPLTPDDLVDDFFADDVPVEPVIGPEQFTNFLIFLSDALVIEMLGNGSSTGGGFQSSFTYLERLCIDQGTPEHICRQRYGQ